MKQTHLIFAFTIALVASSASAGLWDSIKKVGGDAVSTTVGIATSAADAAVKASAGETAEKAAETAEETRTVAPAAVQPPAATSAAPAAADRPTASATTAVQPAAAPAASAVQPRTSDAAAPRASRSSGRASMRPAASDSDAEREAYYAAERRKREAERREEERRQAEFRAKREAEYAAAAKKREAERREEERRQTELLAKREAERAAAAKKREAAQREEERKMAELLAKREAERDAAAKRRAGAMREEERRQAEFRAKREAEQEAATERQAAVRTERRSRGGEREARQKRMEEERVAAREKAESEVREARERMMRERYEKAFAFHRKAHAEAAGNADGYVYKPIAFWDGVKLAMTEEEAYAALTNAHPSVSSWHTNSVPNGAKWIDGTVWTVALPNGSLNLTFAAGETRGLRLLVGAKAVFANAANTTNVVASADVCGRFAKLENVAADKTRAAIDWTWKDGVNDFWRALHDEIARKLERAGEKSLERLSRDRDTIRAEFMDATYEVTDEFTVDGVEIRVVSAEANGAVRLVTVRDVALDKMFGETTDGMAPETPQK